MPRNIRALTVGGLASVGVAALLSAAPTPAVAAPVTSFQVEQTVLTGAPWPVSNQTFRATTARPGVARVSVATSCNTLNRRLCMHYTQGGHIVWLNTSTGRTGTATIPAGARPGTSVNIATGSGQIAAYISAVSGATIVPGAGVFRVF
ncbi:hypothetical protein GOEFS_015_00380 [Gordonia effusa NBRC 100432]|uniref:Secreted protein n=1 Tax=Gordonia effusa NBRC 100432 TaxID=1077974 RepID=H0QVG4_9ACTN|nr:hypothetical protein [Gordonia effusa]GAB16841.1 hypothetical protein GOEFS_015_00380 [Gordonia effusa NBRC 100432]